MDVFKLWIITVKGENYWDFFGPWVQRFISCICMVIACDLLMLSGFEIDKWTAKQLKYYCY